MSDFIQITDDGERMTCPMPNDGSIVEIMLQDGSVTRAYFETNIMEAGDWDFMAVDDDDEPILDGPPLIDEVVAWRPDTAEGRSDADL